MSLALEPIEAAVLQMLLDGDHPVLAALRQQLSGLSVKARDHTGVGFFTELLVAETARPAPLRSGKARFGDVDATSSSLQCGAGFLLYVDDGLLTCLEGYAYEGPWPERPEQIGEFSLRYWEPGRASVLAALG